MRGDKARSSEEVSTITVLPLLSNLCSRSPNTRVPKGPNRSAESPPSETMSNSIRVSLPDDESSRPGAEDDSGGSVDGGSPARPRPQKRRRIPVACGACRSKKSRVRRSSRGGTLGFQTRGIDGEERGRGRDWRPCPPGTILTSLSAAV